MSDLSILAISAISTAIALSALLIREIRYRNTQEQLLHMQIGCRELQDRARNAEVENERLLKERIRLSRRQDICQKLQAQLKDAKGSADYVSGKRYENLEKYIAAHINGGDLDLQFLGTMEYLGLDSIRSMLKEMVQSAEFEIVIVSPWIKRCAWDEIRAPIEDFMERGGKLTVFTRMDELGFADGLADDISDDVDALGGEVISVPQLHAKIYLADQKEAIVTSANLTNGGMETNCEAGIWSSNPILMKEICRFVYSLYRLRDDMHIRAGARSKGPHLNCRKAPPGSNE